MLRKQAFKYRLMPNCEQERKMRRFAGACRFVFNKALALKKEQYDQEKKNLSYNDTAAELIQWKQSTETSWLREVYSQILQQSLKDLDRAYTNFCQKRSDFPKFKRKGIGDSFRYPQGVNQTTTVSIS